MLTLLSRVSRTLRFTSTKKHSTRNAIRIRTKKCGCGTQSGKSWGSQLERRVALLSTCLGGFRNWKGETQSIRLRNGNSQRNNRERKTWSFFQQFEMCSNSESGFWFHSQKHRRRRVHIILRTQKQYLAGSIHTFMQPWRLDKGERLSQQKWRHRVLWPRKTEHKVEVIQVNKLHRICSSSQRRTYGVQGRSLTRNSIEKWNNQLSLFWRKNKTIV